MSAFVHVSATVGGKSSLAEFSKILSQRMKWANETARQSIVATAINALKSIRAITKVARPSQIKVSVDAESTLKPSFTTQGGRKRFCLRVRGSNQRYTGPEKIVAAGAIGPHVDRWGVYRFTDTNGKQAVSYLIAAAGAAQARAKAKAIITAKQKRYAGLAKRAVGVLMFKANGTRTADNAGINVQLKADENTISREQVTRTGSDSGKYTISLQDNLRYALDALKGGRMAADVALKKAMNKTVATINRRLKKADDFFAPYKLPTPFPEVRQRK